MEVQDFRVSRNINRGELLDARLGSVLQGPLLSGTLSWVVDNDNRVG